MLQRPRLQGLAGYQTGASEYEIEDNAAALISAGDNVLTNGNIHVDVNDGAGSLVVDASDGATLASFTADIDFDVSDTAENIADKVSGEVYASGADIDFSDVPFISQTEDVIIKIYDYNLVSVTRYSS